MKRLKVCARREVSVCEREPSSRDSVSHEAAGSRGRRHTPGIIRKETLVRQDGSSSRDEMKRRTNYSEEREFHKMHMAYY